jgi:hypothetical protein
MENPYLEAPQLIDVLLGHGLNVNIQDKYGITPLMQAMDLNITPYEGCGARRDQIRQLVTAGANLNIQDQYGDTALTYGINAINDEYCPDLQDLEILLQNGAKVTEDAFKTSRRSDVTDLLKKYK